MALNQARKIHVVESHMYHCILRNVGGRLTVSGDNTKTKTQSKRESQPSTGTHIHKGDYLQNER